MVLLLSLAGASSARADARRALDRLEAEVGGELVATRHPATGAVRFLRAREPGRRLSTGHPGAAGAKALSFLGRHGEAFGLTAPDQELALVRRQVEPGGETHVSYQQHRRGVPVFGSFLRLHYDRDGALYAVNGTIVPALDIDIRPTLSAAEAQVRARAEGLVIREGRGTRLVIWHDGLLGGSLGSSHLAWEVIGRSKLGTELLLVDGHSGQILQRIERSRHALDRELYSESSASSNVIWREGDPLPYSGTGASPASVNGIIEFTREVYQFFQAIGERDGWDGRGGKFRAVADATRVDVVGGTCPTARWDGSATNYCPNLVSDDLVGHEWTHGYSQGTHGLINLWQSGSLSEAYADIFGEAVDLLNGTGRDAPGGRRDDGACSRYGGSGSGDDTYRWLVGEDLVTALGGAFRDMWKPSCKGLPDRVGDPRYVCGTPSNTGTHTNMGPPIHAFALLVDGGQFNGQTIAGLGLTKAVHIYWRAMSVYEGPSSDFADHADALEQSCRDLAQADTDLRSLVDGTPSGERLTFGDCGELSRAVAAVELRAANPCSAPLLNQNPPPLCAEGRVTSVFRDGFEAAVDHWERRDQGVSATYRPRSWELVDWLPDGRAGRAFFADDRPAIMGYCPPGDDQSSLLTLTSPSIDAPSQPRLSFTHYVSTQPQGDGGNLSIAVADGPFSTIPASAFRFNPYNGVLARGSSNPLAGRPAFSGTDTSSLSGTWGQSHVDLTGLVGEGQPFRLRFEFGADRCFGYFGWFVDDVEVYTCAAAEPSPCVAGDGTLCLLEGRFRVEVDWENQHNGARGHGRAIPATDFAGFWAFDDLANVELMVKILAFDERIKLFYGQLTDLRFTMRVTDTVTGASRSYGNGPGNCDAIDQMAFEKYLSDGTESSSGQCTADADTLCLLHSRFGVEIDWTNPSDGSSGQGSASALSELSGTFSFGDPRNTEVLTKTLDFGDRIIFAYGALTDFEYTLRVTDYSSGTTQSYHNPAGRFCGGLDPDTF